MEQVGMNGETTLPGMGATCPIRGTECTRAECLWWVAEVGLCVMKADLQFRKQLIASADAREAKRAEESAESGRTWRMRVFKAVGQLCGFDVDKLWATAERLCELHPEEADRIAQGKDD